ncbi:MAG TPA: hypothetical protein VND87_09915 [Stellaceae bacterium]|nr:hypothetical protein [Stellaceae bacterium]
MGAAAAAAFMLMLGIHGANGVASLTAMATFSSKAACETAAATAKGALGSSAEPNIGFVCLSAQDLETVFRNSGVR